MVTRAQTQALLNRGRDGCGGAFASFFRSIPNYYQAFLDGYSGFLFRTVRTTVLATFEAGRYLSTVYFCTFPPGQGLSARSLRNTCQVRCIQLSLVEQKDLMEIILPDIAP
ncbi:hypothetical protein HGRIS_006661 [Hohenbuehelia grisea]|uniref:Uncharacterized protein n=1 Tax=Hohenbuehelia grisea TaxID=104357 RepID=A0ABR3J9P4_9AGAR